MTVADRILDYEDYVRRKLALVTREGLDVKPRECGLFDHQRVLVEWALRRGCAAIFADTGLGKSRMQLAWRMLCTWPPAGCGDSGAACSGRSDRGRRR